MRRSVSSLIFVAAFGLVVGTPALLLPRLTTAYANSARAGTLDVGQIKVGMTGYGLSVFRGTEPERFDIEVLGVVHDFRPNQDLILIKTPNERLNIAHTVAGMSGSPIFIDGKMIGAYAYGWQFGSEPVAGVTPIRNMLEDMARPIPPELFKPFSNAPYRSPGFRGNGNKGVFKHANLFEGRMDTYDLKTHSKQLSERLAGARTPPSGSGLAPATTLVSVGGLGNGATQMVRELLNPLGFETLQGGGTGGDTKPDATTPTKFVAGSAVGVQMIRGDISAMGMGTVTRVEGSRLVAFGHPMMQAGLSLLPTAIGRVHWILASEMRSFKIGEPARPAGALINDLQSSIVIDQNVEAPTFPLTVEVEGVPGAPKTKWALELAHDRFISPSFVGVAMGNTVESTISERRDTTWETHTKIAVKGYGVIEVDDFGVAIGGTPGTEDFARSRAARAVGQILNNPWEDIQIEKIAMQMKVAFARDIFSLRGALTLDDVVDAGQPARIQIRLRQFNGPDIIKIIQLTIPKELAGRDVEIELVPGWAESPDLPSPENFAELLANIPRYSYAPDTLLATYRLHEQGVMFNGQVAERLPPSALDTLRPAHDSVAPEAIATIVRIPFAMGHFIDGRDRVHVHVRDILR